jgi:hypothetical protein
VVGQQDKCPQYSHVSRSNDNWSPRAGCIMLGMKWTANRTTIFAAFALVAGGSARIAFAHDFVLGGALVGLGIIIAVRAFFYFRTPDA